MNRFIVFAAILALAPATHAADAAAKKKAKAPDEASAIGDASGGGVSASDRDRFARHLKGRLDKIQKFHQSRLDFFAKETDIWNSFWTKLRDERRQFEIRTARQTLGLFDSLASLDPKDHAVTIADFDRLQGNVIKNFENSQKEKLHDFFVLHDGRWKDFSGEQESERVQFMAEALSGWSEQKEYLKSGKVAAAAEDARETAKEEKKAKAKAPEASEEYAEPEEEAPKAKKSSKPRPSPSKKAPVDQIENWN